MISDLLHRRLTTKAELMAMAMFMKKWPGSLRHQLAIALSDEGCESVGERRTLYMCWAQGLPRPESQYEVIDEAGQVFRLDSPGPSTRCGWSSTDA